MTHIKILLHFSFDEKAWIDILFQIKILIWILII